MKMADKMENGENSAIFGTRITLQMSVLKYLLDKSDFETYLHFTTSHETFVKAFILDKIKKHFSEENRMITLEEEILDAVMKEIRQEIEKAEKDPNINDIKGFIQHICKKLQNKLVIPKDAVDKISTLNNANPQKFAECLQCSVKDMDKSLKASFQERERDFQSKIDCLQTKPQDVLFKQLQGCGKQCPFCKAPCEAGVETHSKHFVLIHRPEGLGGYRNDDSKKLVTDICTSLVYKNGRFKCRDTNDQWHPYNKFKEIYPDWLIDRDPSIDAPAYWKYVMTEFNEQFAEEYNAEPAEIPWENITKADAEESLF